MCRYLTRKNRALASDYINIDVFDTDRMTDGVPQSGNLLTNYTLDLSDVSGESLWLCSYYYEAAQAYKGEKGPKDLPVTRRRDGWSFLIADENDLERLNRLTVDGETALIRVEGELADTAALSWAYDVVDDALPKAMFVYGNRERFPQGDDFAGDDALGELIGMPIGSLSGAIVDVKPQSCSARF